MRASSLDPFIEADHAAKSSKVFCICSFLCLWFCELYVREFRELYVRERAYKSRPYNWICALQLGIFPPVGYASSRPGNSIITASFFAFALLRLREVVSCPI